jgi:hypothetical protein
MSASRQRVCGHGEALGHLPGCGKSGLLLDFPDRGLRLVILDVAAWTVKATSIRRSDVILICTRASRQHVRFRWLILSLRRALGPHDSLAVFYSIHGLCTQLANNWLATEYHARCSAVRSSAAERSARIPNSRLSSGIHQRSLRDPQRNRPCLECGFDCSDRRLHP